MLDPQVMGIWLSGITAIAGQSRRSRSSSSKSTSSPLRLQPYFAPSMYSRILRSPEHTKIPGLTSYSPSQRQWDTGGADETPVPPELRVAYHVLARLHHNTLKEYAYSRVGLARHV